MRNACFLFSFLSSVRFVLLCLTVCCLGSHTPRSASSMFISDTVAHCVILSKSWQGSNCLEFGGYPQNSLQWSVTSMSIRLFHIRNDQTEGCRARISLLYELQGEKEIHFSRAFFLLKVKFHCNGNHEQAGRKTSEFFVISFCRFI